MSNLKNRLSHYLALQRVDETVPTQDKLVVMGIVWAWLHVYEWGTERKHVKCTWIEVVELTHGSRGEDRHWWAIISMPCMPIIRGEQWSWRGQFLTEQRGDGGGARARTTAKVLAHHLLLFSSFGQFDGFLSPQLVQRGL